MISPSGLPPPHLGLAEAQIQSPLALRQRAKFGQVRDLIPHINWPLHEFVGATIQPCQSADNLVVGVAKSDQSHGPAPSWIAAAFAQTVPISDPTFGPDDFAGLRNWKIILTDATFNWQMHDLGMTLMIPGPGCIRWCSFRFAS
jgi:hypothetical protein